MTDRACMHSCVYIFMHQTTVCAVARPRYVTKQERKVHSVNGVSQGVERVKTAEVGGMQRAPHGGETCSFHACSCNTSSTHVTAKGSCHKRVDDIDGHRRVKEQVHVQYNS